MDIMADEIIRSERLNEISEGKGIIDYYDLKDIKGRDDKWIISLSFDMKMCQIAQNGDDHILEHLDNKKLYELFIILSVKHYIKYSNDIKITIGTLCFIFGGIVKNSMMMIEHKYFKSGIKCVNPGSHSIDMPIYIESLVKSLIEDLV